MDVAELRKNMQQFGDKLNDEEMASMIKEAVLCTRIGEVKKILKERNMIGTRTE
mgnify:CR=1 FL=1